MDSKKPSECEPVELKPTKVKVPQIPLYPESKETDLPVTFDETNDPNDVRCSIATLFGGELITGRWKHYLTDDDLKTAPRRYRRVLTDAGWQIGLENFTGDLQYAYVRRKVNGAQQNLIVFFYQESEITHVLIGYRKE